MRVPGSSDGCREAARHLRRAADAVRRAGLDLDPPPPLEWHGTAAQQWGVLTTTRVQSIRRQAERLAASAAAVDRFAEVLDDLQHRARRLTAAAADSGLEIDHDGWVAPVPPPGPEPGSLSDVSARWQVRERIVREATLVREEEALAHGRLVRELAVLHGGRAADAAGEEAWWAPAYEDVPTLALSAGEVAAQLSEKAPAVLRSAAGTTALGAGYGVSVDLSQGRDLDDAVTKAGVTVAAGSAAVAVTTAVAAPVAVPAVGLVVVGAGASYVVGKVFDRVGHHLPWVDRPREGVRGRDAGRTGPRPHPSPHPQKKPRPPQTPEDADISGGRRGAPAT